MEFASSLSTNRESEAALKEAMDVVQQGVSDPDLVMLFTSGFTGREVESMNAGIREAWPEAHTLGCTAEGVIGTGQEVERRPALSLWVGSFPEVSIQPIRLNGQEMVKPGDIQAQLQPLGDPYFLALGDPFTCDIKGFLDQVNEEWPGRPVLGGLASGAAHPGGNQLLLDGEIHDGGLCGLALSGNIHIDTVVSQGCRPVGRHHVITQGEQTIIYQLGGRSAVEVLREMAAELTEADRELLQRGLFVGRAINEYQSEFNRGDFLIQAVMGVDPDSGGIAIAGEARTGTTVQFHLRDADCADEDLRQLLAPTVDAGPASVGALLFSCNGRGTRMWEEPGHDAVVLAEAHGEVPTTGFFCAGEIGPIGDCNFIHGFTASIGLLRSRDGD